MSNGSPWHAKPPPRQSGKLPIAGNEKPNEEHKYFFKYNKPLDSLCHGSRFRGYTPGFEEISFQFLSIAVKKIKQLLYIETKISAMVAPTGPTKEGPALSKVATKDDHYVPSIQWFFYHYVPWAKSRANGLQEWIHTTHEVHFRHVLDGGSAVMWWEYDLAMVAWGILAPV